MMNRHVQQVNAQPPKRVGLWVRVSTDLQVQAESPEHHEARGRHYAEARGWKVEEIYRLDGVSGKAVMDHPEMQRMLRDVRDRRITALIFSKLARLARSTKHLLELSEIFQACSADLVSLQEAIDTSTPAGRLFYTMIGALAQWEREEIAARVAASVPIRAKLGKPLGGAAPFGYQWDARALVPDPAEAPVRRKIYELFLEHRRKKRVARLLNEAGHRTRNGSLFTDTTVDRLIRDPTAKGIRRANHTKSTGDKRHWVTKPEEEWVLTPIESIISEELWEQCNAILDDRRSRVRRPGRTTVHLFAGVTVCMCGEKMYPPSNTPKYVCRKCRNKIPITDLEAVFREQLKEFFLSPDDLAGYLAQSDDVLQAKIDLLGTIETDQARLRQEMEKVYKLYISDGISVDGFRETYGPLEARLKQLGEELPKLQADVDYLKIQQLSRDDVLTEARDLYSRWETLSDDEKRKIVEAIVERIVIGKDDVAIDLCYVPLPEIVATRQRDRTDSWPPRA